MPDVTEVDLVWAVVDAARALVSQPGYALGTLFGTAPGISPDGQAKARLQAAVAQLDVLLDRAPEPEWRMGTWAEVVTGDRVRLGTVEAEVESADLTQWLISGKREVKVKLRDRPKVYIMPPSGQVDILRGPSGQAVDESGVTVTESWPGEQPWDGHRAEMMARNILERTLQAEVISS